MLDDLDGYIMSEIKLRGAVSMDALVCMIRCPPYGYYECNYYIYILARALNPIATAPYKLMNKLYVAEFSSETDCTAWLRKPQGIVFLESDKTRRMVEALDEIFETGFSWSKKSFIDAIYCICSWCEDNIQTPLGCVDHRWFEMLENDFSRYCYRDNVERYYDWICNHVDQHRKDVRCGKEIIYAR